MAYLNEWTRANPGLMIFLINQGCSMNEHISDGITYAEKVSMSVNRMITNMACRFRSGYMIKDQANIVILGYGGAENNTDISVLRSGSIATLYNDDMVPTHRFKQEISDGTGGRLDVDCEIKQFVLPKAVGKESITSAFDTTSTLLDEWVAISKESRHEDGNIMARDSSYDPVPVIINFSNASSKITNQTIAFAKKIFEIGLPDGNPLIINCIYDANPLIKGFPNLSKFVDVYYKDFGVISSSVPHEMISQMQECGFVNVTDISKFLFLNPSDNDLDSLMDAILWINDSGSYDNSVLR